MSSANRTQTAIELLNDDHRRITELFATYDAAKHAGDVARKREIAEAACVELALHNEVEEELFYPRVRECAGRQLLDEAEVEHATACQLIATLGTLSADDPRFDATFAVLGHY